MPAAEDARLFPTIWGRESKDGTLPPVFWYIRERNAVIFDMKRSLDIKIGGEPFYILLGKKNSRLFHWVEKIFIPYRSERNSNACRVEIIPWRYKKFFSWERSELERFRDFFYLIYRRAPSTGMADEKVDLSLERLQFFDPEDTGMKHIRSRILEPDSLIYARTGFDQYFFDIKSNRALFIVRDNLRTGLLADFLNEFGLRSPDMLLGVLSGFMFLLSYYLIRHKGLLVHGTALQRDGKTMLFLGPSGTGKTTIANICRPDFCFSDDGVVIKKEGDNFYAYCSPFRQIKYNKDCSGDYRGKIQKIFLLEKGDSNSISSIEKNKIMNKILMHLIHFFMYLDGDTARLGFLFVKDLLDKIPAYTLEFAKNKKIWDDIVK